MSSLQSVPNMRPMIPAQPVTITRLIRRLRGGSQAWLVECDNNQYYAAKFLGNPQGRRTLINELVAHSLIKGAGILTPHVSLLHLPEVLDHDDGLCFLVGNKKLRPEGRLHFGSQFPANPQTTAIFDFLPDRLLCKVSNLNDLAYMFVYSIWCYQSDSTQVIYIRNRHGGSKPYKAYSVDHGLFFGGARWDLRDAPLHGLGFHKRIYSQIDMRRITDEAVAVVQGLPEQALQEAAKTVPPSWLAPGDSERLAALISCLRKRQAALAPLIKRQLDSLGF